MATIKVRGILKGALALCVLAAFWNGACSTSEPVKPSEPHPSIQVTPSAVTLKDTVGATTHPGASVTGAPGRNCAQVLLGDLGTSLADVIARTAASARA